MHIAIIALDALTIAVALGLARMIRLRFFYVAIVLVFVLGIARLHYGLNYQWTFLGKYGVNVAIPLVMAWAGNHLAAKSSDSETEKRLWQALFLTLTVLALAGSFWVLTNEDEEHKTEMSTLRIGIKADVATALFDYNAAHPQHQITSEQYAEITSVLSGRGAANVPNGPRPHRQVSKPAVVAQSCYEPDAGKPYDKCSKQELKALAVNFLPRLSKTMQNLEDALQSSFRNSTNPADRAVYVRGDEAVAARDFKLCCFQDAKLLRMALIKWLGPGSQNHTYDTFYEDKMWNIVPVNTHAMDAQSVKEDLESFIAQLN